MLYIYIIIYVIYIYIWYFLCIYIYIYYQTKKQKQKNKDHICSVLITIWHIYTYWEVNFEVKMGILSICQMDTWHIYIYINLYMCLGKNLFKGVCKRLQTVPQSRTEDWRLKAWEKLLQSRVLDWRFLGSRSFPQAFNLQSSILDWRIFSQVLNLQYLIRNKTSWYQCSGKGILCMKRVSTFGLFPAL